MKALVLYWGSASGSRSAGLAMREQIMAQGDSCELLNCYTVASRKIPKKLLDTYQEVEKKETNSADDTRMWLQGLAKQANYHYTFIKAAIKKQVFRHILEGDFDVIMVTHILPAEIVTMLIHDGQPMPLVVALIPEYGYAPGWEKTECSRYILADPSLVDVYSRAGIDKKRILACGIPVRMDFAKHMEKEAARRKLHLNQDGRLYLIMVGSKGVGEADTLLEEFVGYCGPDDIIVVLCGSNRKAYCYLRDKYGAELAVIIREYTPYANLYMDACDVMFTAPSGVISTEAAVKNVPLIYLKPLTSCETDNAEFFEDRGMAVNKNSVPAKIKEALAIGESPEKAEKIMCAQRQGVQTNASYDIYCLLKELS